MGRRVNFSGLVIAGIGFFLTRFTVSLAISGGPVQFLLSGIVPLALGLGLAAFGVALTVADVEARLVRTTAAWCVAGTGGMLVLVVLTILGDPEMSSALETIRAQAHFSTFLIGGSVGGTFTGLYAARNRRQRTTVQREANRLVVLNRILRHEVLNALTPIRGFGALDGGDHPEARQVIEDRADDIEATVEEISYLTKRAGHEGPVGVPVDLATTIDESVATVTERHAVTVETPVVPDHVRVAANDRLTDVVTQLLENAVVHGGDETPALEVSASQRQVRVRVIDEGDGLPESQRRLLETGDIEEYDDPRVGYGLNVVRLLIESYGGAIETDRTDGETRITVVLPRVNDGGPGVEASTSSLAGIRPDVPNLVVTLIASLLAGVAYGLVAESTGGSVAGIGVFYGNPEPVVGWLTHEFHSVVFGFVFAGLVSLVPREYGDRTLTNVAVATGWGLAVWIGAAGVVAPVWLRLLGIGAPLPNLTASLLLNHLAWGVSLGLFATWGQRYLTPWLSVIRE